MMKQIACHSLLMSASGEWRAILIGIFAVGYFFVNWGKRRDLIKGLDNDSRIAGRLAADDAGDAAHVAAAFSSVRIALPYDSPLAKRGLGCLWIGVPLALLGAWLCLSESRSTRDSAVVLLSIGLLVVACDTFFRWRNAKADPLVEAVLSSDCLEVRRFSGATTVFLYGPKVVFEIGFKEVKKSAAMGAQELQGFEYSVKVSEGESKVLIPLSFDGAGEFLGRCRHMGSPVVFSSSCPSWFKAKMEALPSWQPGYFGDKEDDGRR